MLDFEFNVTDQHLFIEKDSVLISYMKNAYRLHYIFDNIWNGFTKTAVFLLSDGRIIEVLLDNTNICALPYEVVDGKNKSVQFGIYGTKDDIFLATTYSRKIRINPGASDGSVAQLPTPSVYQQVINKVDNLEEDIKSPYIGTNGHLYLWDPDLNIYIDSEIERDTQIPIVTIEAMTNEDILNLIS